MTFLDENKPILYMQSSFRCFYENEHHVTRRCNYSVIVLVYKGILRFNENGVDIELHPGEYYIQIEGLPQSGPLPSSSPHYFYIHFKADYCDTSGLPIRGKWDASALRTELEKLESYEQTNESLLQKTSVFHTILKELSSKNNKKRNPLAESIMHELHSNYRSQVKLSEIASKLFISENHLISVFRLEYGITPHRHLTDLRLSEALRLLSDTQRSESEISRTVGFSDVSVFFKAFKKRYGITPSKARKGL